MDIEDDVFRIFSALDDQNQGFIDKDTFLNTILEYTSSLGDLQNEEIERIKELMDPFEKIRFSEFKEIYKHIEGAKNASLEAIRSSSSTESSDVDDSEELTFNKKPPISSPSSAKKHGLELLNQSRTSLSRMISGPTKSDSECSSMKNNSHMEMASTEDWDALVLDNERMSEEVENLRGSLAKMEVRCQNEKDQNKKTGERVYYLEGQIHDMEVRHKAELHQLKEVCAAKIESANNDCSAKEIRLSQECAEMQRVWYESRQHCEEVQLKYDEVLSRYDVLHKNYSSLQSKMREHENLLIEYKRVASHQVTELQTERDQLEMVSKELYVELQTLRHLSNKESARGAVEDSSNVVMRTRQRVRSTIVNAKSNKHLSIGSVASDNVPPRGTGTENDMNRLVHQLTIENRDLVERIAHLETVGYYQKQKLEASHCLSLADEMERLTLDEVRSALTMERETVISLKEYMEKLTIKLISLGYVDVFLRG